MYASDEEVMTLQNKLGRGGCLQHVYNAEEAQREFTAIRRFVDPILRSLVHFLGMEGELRIAIVASSQSFQAVCLHNQFYILIDGWNFYRLLTLCDRVQSLTPLAEFLGLPAIAEPRDFTGQVLLGITKETIYNTHENALWLMQSDRIVHQAAVAFIIAHEFAHIIHGHLDFKMSPIYAEFRATPEEENLTLRTLEMDADSSATTSVFMLFENLLINPSCHPKPLASELVRRQYVAGTFAALLFGESLTTNTTPKAHPIGYARFLTVSGVMDIAMNRSLGNSGITEEVRSKMVDAFVNLSGGLQYLEHPMASNITVYYQGETFSSYDLMGILMGKAHLTPLDLQWTKIRPHLASLKRGGGLAPAGAQS